MERWAWIHAFACIHEDKYMCLCDLYSANLFLLPVSSLVQLPSLRFIRCSIPLFPYLLHITLCTE